MSSVEGKGEERVTVVFMRKMRATVLLGAWTFPALLSCAACAGGGALSHGPGSGPPCVRETIRPARRCGVLVAQGCVLDQEELPVEGARILLSWEEGSLEAETDASGTFAVRASRFPGAPFRARVFIFHEAFFFPHQGGSLCLEEDGADRPLLFRVERWARLLLYVYDPSGKPVRHVRVTPFPDTHDPGPPADGDVRIQVRPLEEGVRLERVPPGRALRLYVQGAAGSRRVRVPPLLPQEVRRIVVYLEPRPGAMDRPGAKGRTTGGTGR